MATGTLDSLASQLRPNIALRIGRREPEVMETLRVCASLLTRVATWPRRPSVPGRHAHIACLGHPRGRRRTESWRQAQRTESVVAYFGLARGEISTSAPSNGAARLSAQFKCLSGTARNISEASLAYTVCGRGSGWWREDAMTGSAVRVVSDIRGVRTRFLGFCHGYASMGIDNRADTCPSAHIPRVRTGACGAAPPRLAGSRAALVGRGNGLGMFVWSAWIL